MQRLRAAVAAVMAFALVSSASPCFADDWSAPVVIPLKKGDPAPFSGVMLTPQAVAKVIAEAQGCDGRVKAESDNARAVQKAEDDKSAADAKAESDQQRAVMQAGLDRRDAQIKGLTESLQKAEDSSKTPWLWAAGGVAAGVVVALGAVLVVGLATKR